MGISINIDETGTCPHTAGLPRVDPSGMRPADGCCAPSLRVPPQPGGHRVPELLGVLDHREMAASLDRGEVGIRDGGGQEPAPLTWDRVELGVDDQRRASMPANFLIGSSAPRLPIIRCGACWTLAAVISVNPRLTRSMAERSLKNGMKVLSWWRSRACG